MARTLRRLVLYLGRLVLLLHLHDRRSGVLVLVLVLYLHDILVVIVATFLIVVGPDSWSGHHNPGGGERKRG